MLYALASPVLLVGLLSGWLLGVCLHGALQARLLARAGERRPLTEGAGNPSPRRQVDPFGAVLTLVGIGPGRAPGVDVSGRSRRAAVDVALLAPALLLVALGVVLLAGVLAAAGLGVEGEVGLVVVLRGLTTGQGPLVDVGLGAAAALVLLGLLHLVPVPPLDAGLVLLRRGGQTPGWQRVRVWFGEQNWGFAVLLVASLIPLGAREPPLLFLLDVLSRPLVAVAGLAA